MAIFKPMACGHHSHIDEGSLDAGSNCKQKIINADELGRIADCVTDHGTMSSLANHWVTANKLYKDKKITNKIQSIHGIELYVIDERRPPKEYKNGKKEPKYSHLTIHFKNIDAYKYLCQMTPIMESRALVKFGERKPLIYLHELEPIAGSIIISTGCLMGVVQKNLLPDNSIPLVDRMKWAEEDYCYLRDLAGKDGLFCEIFPHIIDHDWVRPVYSKEKKEIEVQGHFKPILEKNHICGSQCSHLEHFTDECGHLTVNIDIQKDANKFIIEMARKYGDSLVISEDDHVAAPEDKIAQDARLGNGKENWKFYNCYCQRDTNEWAVNLKSQLNLSDRDIEEMVDNSYKFVDLFKDYTMETSKDRVLLPTVEMVYGESIDTEVKLHQLIEKHGRMPTKDDPKYQEYKDRVDSEIKALKYNSKNIDFLPYIFVIEDAADYAKKNNITSTARGSAGGSLIVYLLGISMTDPIRYGLQFERFLTEGRVSSGNLPDIDTDWEERDVIIKYILGKYGDRAALISTNMMMRVKSAIKDIERFRIGYVKEETNDLLRQIKPKANISDMDWLYGFTDKTTGARALGYLEQEDDPLAMEFKRYTETAYWVDDNKEEHLIWPEVLQCLDITRGKGVHAGGVVITPGPVCDYIPLICPKGEGMLSTAYTMKYVEEVGLVKYDFLGVKTLKSLGITLKSIKEKTGVSIPWKEFDQENMAYSEVINKGKLAGLFQIDTDTMRPYVNQIQPKNIIDLSNIAALVRPGTLSAPSPDPRDSLEETAASYYVKCCQGVKTPYFIHDDLIPILSHTQGIVLFQEQSLRIFRDLAGYSYSVCEEVRRAIGKKIPAELNKHGGYLKECCMKRGWTEEQAIRLFDTIVASGSYSFNMAHSVSYGILCHNGAYLKYKYPAHYWKGELSIRGDDHDTIRVFLTECSKYILPVDILKSHPTDWQIEDVKGNEMLRPPLKTIKGCGPKSVLGLKSFLDAETPEDIVIVDENYDERIEALTPEQIDAGEDYEFYGDDDEQ